MQRLLAACPTGDAAAFGKSVTTRAAESNSDTYPFKPNTHLPVVSQEFPGFAVDVTQVHSACHAGRVQVTQVGQVRCVFRDFLQKGESFIGYST